MSTDSAESLGRVLVVDDEEGIRVLCRVNLELGGFSVLEAADGAEAVAVAQSEIPDVIFLDLMMPVMDGWDALAALRDHEATAHIPIILLTARTAEEDQLRGWGEGIFEYLSKPFNPSVLVEYAQQAIEPGSDDEVEVRRQRAMEQLRVVQELRRRQ
jgi:CheY-like chemotaxis protein